MKSKQRKWRVFRIRFALDIVTVLAGIIVALTGEGAEPLLIAGFGDLSVNCATYFAANVAQKRIISENYHPEMAE